MVPARSAARSCSIAPEAAVGGKLVVDRNRRVRIAARHFGGLAEPGEHAVARRAAGGELGEGLLGLLVLAFAGKRDGGLEGGAGLGGLLGLPPLVGPPAADRDDQQNAGGDEQYAVALPQLLELFAADFLINFLEDIGH